MDVFEEHLAAVELHLKNKCDDLEQTNDHLEDVLHFLKRTILELREVDEQAQVVRERYEEEKGRLQQEYYRGSKGPAERVKVEKKGEDSKKEAKGDAKLQKEEGEGAPSLEDILSKARNLRETKANRDPPPPFVGGGSVSRTKKSEAPASKVGSRTAPKKAPGKPPSATTTRRPLHDAKSAPNRGAAEKLSAPKTRPSSSGSKSTPKSPPRKIPASSPKKELATPPVSPDKKLTATNVEKMPPSPPTLTLPPPPAEPEAGPLMKHLFKELGKKRRYPTTVDGELDEDAYIAMAACPSKDAFIRRAKFLSEVKGRPTLPTSMVMALLEQEEEEAGEGGYREEEEDKEPPLVEESEEKQQLLETIAAVHEDLLEVKRRYDRRWSLRLKRLQQEAGDGSPMAYAEKLEQLQDSEIEELFRMWYRSRRLHDIYEDLRDHLEKVDGESVEDPLEMLREAQAEDEANIDPAIRRVNKLYDDLIGSLPSRTPLRQHLPWPPRRKNGQLSVHPHEAKINEFHDAVRSRVEFMVETVLGSTLLRDLVHDMRQVCSQESTSRSAWVLVLKKYKLVYSMLVDRARSTSSIKFLNR